MAVHALLRACEKATKPISPHTGGGLSDNEKGEASRPPFGMPAKQKNGAEQVAFCFKEHAHFLS